MFLAYAVFGASYYDKAVSKRDLPGRVIYFGSVAFADSASGTNYYTQAMLVSPFSAANAYGYFVCSEVGTEDVNVFVEYSNDRLTWYAGTTNSSLDAVGTTAKTDTLNIVAGAHDMIYHTFVWVRLKFTAGQAINSTTITWSVGFDKPSGIQNKKPAAVMNRDT
jgi:hypothetical protein